MHPFIVQGEVAALSLLGFLALIPGLDKSGTLRITPPLKLALAYAGIFLLVAPWFVMPFLNQPRLTGVLAPFVSYIGVILIFAGIALFGVALHTLLPAFRKQFTEFTPETLIVGGPYKLVRHPIYLACLTVLFGLYITLGAIASLALLPLAYGLFLFVTLYEERRILAPLFGEDHSLYQTHVATVIFGRWGTVLFFVLCLAPLLALIR